MKRLTILVAALLALVFAGAANASEYRVARGDCLSVIGAKLHTRWQTIAKNNHIVSPYVIYPGQNLDVPEKTINVKTTAKPAAKGANKKAAEKNTVRNSEIIKIYSDENINTDAYQGTITEAKALLGFSEISKTKFKGYSFLKPGDFVRMTHGQGKVHTYNVRISKPLKTWEYSIILDGREIGTICWMKECTNYYNDLKPKPRLLESATPAEPFKQVVKEYPIIIGQTGLAIENEPIFWAYYWENDNIAKGWGGGIEYMAWLRRTYNSLYENGWSPGIGFYATYAEGDSKLSQYGWHERAWGPSVGIKYIGLTENGNFWQWQLKFRYVWEYQKGFNSESRYSRKQWNEKPGLYTELLYQYDEKTVFGLQAEGWLTTHRSLESSWSGDKMQNRDQLSVFLLAQRKFTDNWSGRFAIGPFYAGWDNMWGMRAILEARYKEMLMFGPSVAWYPFGINHALYEGFSSGDLTTWMGFVRVELGNPIRNWDYTTRMNQVREIDYKELGINE